MMRLPLVRIAPVAFGYGPLGKALHLARALRLLVGGSIRLELVASENFTSPIDDDLFDAIYPSMEGLQQADIVITFMNIGGAHAAYARGERVFVVDSLAWLWDKPLPIEDVAERYFYQALPLLPVPEANLSGMPAPTPIPAISASDSLLRNSAETPRNRVVVSLSGLESPATNAKDGSLFYPAHILDSLESLLRDRRVDPAACQVFGNVGVLRAVAGMETLKTLGDGSQVSFLSAASRSRVLAAPPGLTTMIEALRGGIPIVMLPAQNYSQVRLFRAFAEVGVGGVDWSSPLERWLSSAVLPEWVGAQIAAGIVSTARLRDRKYDETRLERLLSEPAPIMPPARVTELLGSGDGAAVIANAVVGAL